MGMNIDNIEKQDYDCADEEHVEKDNACRVWYLAFCEFGDDDQKHCKYFEAQDKDFGNSNHCEHYQFRDGGETLEHLCTCRDARLDFLLDCHNKDVDIEFLED